jgi:hypothetical protein
MTSSQNIDDEDVPLDNSLAGDPNSEEIRHIFSLMDDPSIIIIDEFDRLRNEQIERAFTDTIKTPCRTMASMQRSS